MSEKNNMCRIPVVAHMAVDENGRYYVDKEHSIYADIPADVIAKYIIDHIGTAWEGAAID